MKIAAFLMVSMICFVTGSSSGQEVGTTEWLDSPAMSPFFVRPLDEKFFRKSKGQKPPRGKYYVSDVMSLNTGLQELDAIADLDGKKYLDSDEAEELIRDKVLGNEAINLIVYRADWTNKKKIAWKKHKIEVQPLSQRGLLEFFVAIEPDVMSDVIIFRHRFEPKIGETGFNIFFASTENKPGYKTYFQALHHGRSYFGFSRLSIKCGDRVYSFERNIFERHTDITASGVSEWFNSELKGKDLELLQDLASREVTIRWEGENFRQDESFTTTDRARFQVLRNFKTCLDKGTWQ